MLDNVLKFIADELNSYLKSKTGVTDDIISPGQIIDDSGKYALPKESIALTLINIEPETAANQPLPSSKFVEGKTVCLPPELRLNLCIMFVARFTIYDQALKYLSHIMNFFQTHPVFNADACPALEPPSERLMLELQSPNYDQLNQIWGYLGGKHLPSVMYKVRGVRLTDHDVPKVGPPVLEVNNDLHSI